MVILRSARAYPDAATALFNRAVQDDRMRRAAYTELMGFTPTMVDVSPEAIVAVAKAEILEELPQDKIDREERENQERIEQIRRIRSIPENKLTEAQRRTLDNLPFVPLGRSSPDLDDIGIDRHHTYYYPVSALHEPFATLLAKRPDVGLRLIHDLANHATKGWRQIQALDRRRGTPIPVSVEFPWGTQEFWGDWHVYNWFLGHLAPQPLDCAFLALSYWAFKQIEAGRPADEVIRAVLEGSECYASVGLALVLALETHETSETTLPLVTCQRLWHHDLARVVQEPMRNVDLLGWGLGELTKLSGEQAKAKEFLESRASYSREVRELTMRFAIGSDEALRARLRVALATFPDALPYEIEEHRANKAVTADLKEKAERWAGLGDIGNYRKHATETDEYVITYNPPDPLTPDQEERLKASNTFMQEQSVIAWAMKSLNGGALDDSIALDPAVAFARMRDAPGILDERLDAVEHTAQTTLSAVAAVVIRFGPQSGADYDWAWSVMERVARMREPQEHLYGSRIPWHPANHLIVALAHDRRSSTLRKDSARTLVELTAHPVEGVAQLAFTALFADQDEHVRWIAAQLALEQSLYYRHKLNADGSWDHSAANEAREVSLARAIQRLTKPDGSPLLEIPPAWVKADATRHRRQSDDGANWDDPDPSFNGQYASKLLPLFPVEAWCRSETYRPMFAKTLKELCGWTAERLMPSWRSGNRRRSERTGTDLIEWGHALGDVLARAAPFFDTSEVRRDFLDPFLTNDEEGLNVLASFVEMTVLRHVMDAPTIPGNTFDLLNAAVDRVIADPAFRPGGYRAGEVHGWDMPNLIRALLFVNFDGTAPGSARFGNGDWSQVSLIMPIVTRMVQAIGGSSFVMQNYLALCERAGPYYPLDAFGEQANSVLSAIANARGSWVGTTHPARIAGTVQRLADANFPLRLNQAQALLKILDALIDLGDRRSAALEQTEAFKGIQG